MAVTWFRKKTGPGDGILNKLWPHNHIAYVWLICLFQGPFTSKVICEFQFVKVSFYLTVSCKLSYHPSYLVSV
jgi:hypothetical protein